MIASHRPVPLSRTEFLAAVRASGILTSHQLDRIIASVPGSIVSTDDLAAYLIEQGHLTRFQVDRLFAGKTDGFVFGQYIFLELLGRSALGRVFKARHRAMNRLVAIKVLAAEHTRDDRRRDQFQVEARQAARLIHPNVITILDTNQVGDRLFLVLEYIEGTSLDRLIRTNGPVTLARACELVRQAALGLAHVHEKGLTHGCVSPANVLVGVSNHHAQDERPTVKIANVGFGRSMATTLPTEGNCASNDFRAPDLNGATVQADIYGLGAVLAFLLTGKAVPALTGNWIRSEWPTAIVTLLKSLLSKNPMDRPTSASDVANTLTPFAEQDDPTRVDFNMPSYTAGPNSTVGTSLTGVRLPVAPRPALDITDTSPWTALDTPTIEGENGATPISMSTPTGAFRKTSQTPMSVIFLAITIILGTFLAMLFVLKFFQLV